MRNRFFFFLFILISLFQPLLFPLSVTIRSFDHRDFTRIVFEGDSSFAFDFNSSARTIDLELRQPALNKEELIRIDNSALIDSVQHKKVRNKSVYTIRLKSDFDIRQNFVLERPYRVVFDLVKSSKPETPAIPPPLKEESQDQEEPERETPAPMDANNDIVINTICLDPGHGGTDLGAVGKNKLMEKDVTMTISSKLKEVIEARLGLRVVMTRDKDVEVSLNSRVAIANNQKAQIFVSIHVNSSFRKAARGTETYFVSLKATDQESYELAVKENQAGEEIDQLADNDDLKMILWDMAQADYIRESSKLAEFIQNECNVLMNTLNRGVKQAPFRVLMRAAMPAVLVEVAFVSNPTEEMKLRNNEFLDQVANALYSGIAKFIQYHNQVYR